MDNKLVNQLLSYRQIKDEDFETGGVFMGELYPKSNRIKITHILVCQNTDSSRYEVELNIECLQKQMDKIWEESKCTITYLGDWHTHPEFTPKPSFTDYKTFVKNYYTSKFEQNLLLYMIVGTNKNIWCKSFNGLRFQELKF